jgi:hypothetical protein
MKKSHSVLFLLPVFAMFLLPFKLIRADVPEKKEELVYKILAFNGKDYSHTFCREEADTIYLLADTDNFITVTKTFVYFWPITGEWNTDYKTLDEVMNGQIEIIDATSGRSRSLHTVAYTYFNTRDEYENSWKVLQGADAHRELEKWKKMYFNYIKAIEEYHHALEAYKRKFNDLMNTANDMRKRGRDAREILENINSLTQPQEPVQPQYYTVPPAPVEEAFIVNLSAGAYEARFILPNGELLEGSEKKLVCFAERRGNGIGFDVIPGDKWTRPVQNKNPHSVIYVNGETDIFLRPFLQYEYNDLYYNKLLRNDSTGNIHMYDWKRVQQVPSTEVELIYHDGRKERIEESPFVVEQLKGASLGYTIVPYDPEGRHAGGPPSLIAFRIPKQYIKRSVMLRLLDENSTVIPNSDREIRVIRNSKYRHIPVLFFFLTILSLFAAFLLQRRRYAS